MKKLFYFAAAAVALAACAKNEVVPVNSGENQEITFNVAPKTKADPDEHGHNEFGKGNKFASWAYYLGPNKTWKDNSADAKEYISGATISYNTTEKVWKADKSYYWPKDGGKLTFFAYSLNKGDMDLISDNKSTSEFTCTWNNGVTGHIDLQLNPNTDFLVAEIAKDKTSNVTTHFTDGVPTLFKHRLSSVVFAIKTGANYADKAFKLTGITVHNLSHYGVYGQLPTESFSASGTKYNPVFTSTAQDITYQTDFVGVTGVNESIFIPQEFEKGSDDKTNAYIEVKYTITTKVGTDEHGADIVVKEDVTKQIFLNPEDGKGTKMFDSWEMGKKYTINLTFTLGEILWDPAVLDWADVTPAAGQDIA